MIKALVSAFGFIVLMLTSVAFATPVPDTGQTKCYNDTVEIACPSSGQAFYGQDASYTINTPSYTKLDGSGVALPDSAGSWVMVKDNVTGLIWEMKTNKDGVQNYSDPHDADNTYTWYDSNPATNGGYAGTPGIDTDTEDFIKSLNDAHYGGYSNWRLPTSKELAYIVNYSIVEPGPTIDTGYFPNTVPGIYCSSTTSFYWTYTWGVFFYYGGDHYQCDKFGSFYARAVRGGQTQSAYTDNGNGTVTDTSTGLMWQQAGSSGTWEQALAYCEGLNLGGYTDWRLPAIKELRSLVDYSLVSPAINTTYFPDTVSSIYWSSTTYPTSTRAWGVHFVDGTDTSPYPYPGKYPILCVRAVRGGQTGSLGNLVISPSNRDVAKEAGTTSFSVSTTGTGTMPWTATVTSDSSWFSITSGASGTDTGIINCSFSANTSTSIRTATIRVTATGATDSPMGVTVTQAPTPTPVLSVSPAKQIVQKEVGTTTFSVSTTGTWTATVTSGSWLRITSGASGTNSGTITCSFPSNTALRAATIRVTSSGASSPVDVTVTQQGVAANLSLKVNAASNTTANKIYYRTGTSTTPTTVTLPWTEKAVYGGIAEGEVKITVTNKMAGDLIVKVDILTATGGVLSVSSGWLKYDNDAGPFGGPAVIMAASQQVVNGVEVNAGSLSTLVLKNDFTAVTTFTLFDFFTTFYSPAHIIFTAVMVDSALAQNPQVIGVDIQSIFFNAIDTTDIITPGEWWSVKPIWLTLIQSSGS